MFIGWDKPAALSSRVGLKRGMKMNDELESLWRTGKRLLAAVVFVCLLVGAGSAVVTALAAGINSLSQFSANRGAATSPSAPVSAQPEGYANRTATGSNAATGGNDGADLGLASAGDGVSGVGGAPADSASEAGAAGTGSVSSSQGGQFYSPVGEAIDQGGGVLGDKVQQGFGHLLG
ncbi:MAG: hypothetical protein K6T68_13535, partial [Alicyclobacillus shizuokensis]|nr:hypothetical protein [Alicyclobacillus shizuokensis]